MGDGTSAIIHINRLKRAYERTKGKSALPLSNNLKEKAKLKDFKTIAPRENDEIETEKLDVEIPSHPLIRNVENNESDRSDDDAISSSHRCVEDTEWNPGSSYSYVIC